MTPVIGIVGWKNSGKTTLAVRLIEELTRRGLRVASVKHAHHSFRIDDDDTDSARHRRAGAAQVAIVSSKRWALMTETPDDAEPGLSEILAKLAPADIVIVEGYKAAPIDKIEVRRQASAHPDRPLAPHDPHVIAIATDDPTAHKDLLPKFSLDDVPSLADLIVDRFIPRSS
jgi:molybdopterin-guanine dinucleotide biosynthesis adapter protein